MTIEIRFDCLIKEIKLNLNLGKVLAFNITDGHLDLPKMSCKFEWNVLELNEWKSKWS